MLRLANDEAQKKRDEEEKAATESETMLRLAGDEAQLQRDEEKAADKKKAFETKEAENDKLVEHLKSVAQKAHKELLVERADNDKIVEHLKSVAQEAVASAEMAAQAKGCRPYDMAVAARRDDLAKIAHEEASVVDDKKSAEDPKLTVHTHKNESIKAFFGGTGTGAPDETKYIKCASEPEQLTGDEKSDEGEKVAEMAVGAPTQEPDLDLQI
jgi:hypothetical protein